MKDEGWRMEDLRFELKARRVPTADDFVSPFRGILVAPATSIVVIVLPTGVPQEAMRHKPVVNVISRDCASRVNADGERALEDNCASAWNLELAEGAVRSPHVIVKHT